MTEKGIIDYLDGKLLDCDQIKEAEDWIKESSINRATAEDMYFTLHSLKSMTIMETVDARKAFQRFHDEIHRSKRNIFIRNVVRYVERVAAILILPVGIALGYMFQTGHGLSVPMLEVRSQTGMVSKVELPDGTVSWLGSSSTLKYPMTFKGHKRNVELEGQAYFDVAKDKTRPFVVSTPYAYSVEALGTEFDLCARKNDKIFETTLVEGLVNITYDDGKQKFSKNIYPDHRLKYNRMTGTFTVDKVNASQKTAWKDGCFFFQDTPMLEVLSELEKFYNVKFKVIDSGALKNSRITARFKNESVFQILEYLQITSDINYKLLKQNAYDETQSCTTIEIKE